MKSLSEYELEVNSLYAEAISSETLAEKLLLLAGEGNPHAMLELGTLYEKGSGVEQNNNAAISQYVLAGEMGLLQAKYQLGVTWEFGRCGVAPSYELASKIYKEVADLGHSDAQCQLGGLYERGYGVEQNHETAALYYKLSSENGNTRATFLLADCYMNGLGVIKSVTEALNLFHKAANQGHGFSQLILAVRYKHGHELPTDYVKAYTYADLASHNATTESDRSSAIRLRDEIYGRMSDAEKNAVLP